MKKTFKSLATSAKLLTLVLGLMVAGLLAACGDTTATSLPPTPAATTAPATATAAPVPTTQTVTTAAPTTVASTTAPATTVAATPVSTTKPATTVATGTTAPATVSGEPAYADRTKPENLVHAFYNAIDLKDYQRAYTYWQNPGQGQPNTPGSYADFAKGYGDTLSVQYTLGQIMSDAGAGNIYAGIPIVLTSTHTDGSKTSFAGCYVAHRVNDGISSNPDDSLWRFVSGTLATASAGAQPDPKSCPNQFVANPGGTSAPSGYTDRTEPENLVHAFYDAIDNKDYQRAYSYWQAPGQGQPNTPGSYADFAKGYGDTVSVQYSLGKIVSDAGAGNIYASIPIALTSTHTDGSKTTFTGCYIAHRVNDGISPDPQAVLWKFVSGKLGTAAAGAQPPDPASCQPR